MHDDAPPTGAAGHASSRSLVLDAIRVAGTISRVELTQSTGLTGATISTVVRRLIEDGLVVESGRAESTGGKPRVLLQLEPSSRYAVGINLDHAGIHFAVANLGGQLVASGSLPGAGSDLPREVLERTWRDVDAALSEAGIEREKVLGIGFVSPGPIHPPVGMTFVPPFMEPWAGFPLRETVAAISGLPVLLENDATASAIGEYWVGGDEHTTAFGTIFLGTGIGSGVLVNGAVYRGASSNAGEIGHVCVDVDGPACWCGSRGCVEAVAGPGAVVRAAEDKGLALEGESVAERFAEVVAAAKRKEQPALELLERSAQVVAVAAQTLANVMDLGHIVLTGPVMAIAAEFYAPAVTAQLQGTFFARLNHQVGVAVSENASRAAAVGGAALVLHTELAPRLPGAGRPLTR